MHHDSGIVTTLEDSLLLLSFHIARMAPAAAERGGF